MCQGLQSPSLAHTAWRCLQTALHGSVQQKSKNKFKKKTNILWHLSTAIKRGRPEQRWALLQSQDHHPVFHSHLSSFSSILKDSPWNPVVLGCRHKGHQRSDWRTPQPKGCLCVQKPYAAFLCLSYSHPILKNRSGFMRTVCQVSK